MCAFCFRLSAKCFVVDATQCAIPKLSDGRPCRLLKTGFWISNSSNDIDAQDCIEPLLMTKCITANMAHVDLKMVFKQGDSATYTWTTPVCALVKGAFTLTAGVCEACSARRSERERPGCDVRPLLPDESFHALAYIGTR